MTRDSSAPEALATTSTAESDSFGPISPRMRSGHGCLSLWTQFSTSFLQASEAGDRSNLARSSSTRRLLMASIGLSTKDMRGQKIRRQSRKRAAWRQPTLQRCRAVQDRAEPLNLEVLEVAIILLRSRERTGFSMKGLPNGWESRRKDRSLFSSTLAVEDMGIRSVVII